MEKFGKVFILSLAGLFLLIAFGTVAYGAAITDSTDPLLSGATVITFNEVPVGMIDPTIFGVSFSGLGGAGAYTQVSIDGFYPTAPVLDNWTYDVVISFATPVTAFGMDIFVADRDVIVSAYDAADAVLGSVTLESPPDEIVSGFRGIGDVGLISYALIDVNNVTERIRVDNVHFVSSVPEPATMLLLGSCLVGLAGLRRKFRKK